MHYNPATKQKKRPCEVSSGKAINRAWEWAFIASFDYIIGIFADFVKKAQPNLIFSLLAHHQPLGTLGDGFLFAWSYCPGRHLDDNKKGYAPSHA